MKHVNGLLLGLLLAVFALAPSIVTAQTPVKLEVYNPTGAIEVTQLFAQRLTDLNGKTICEISANHWEAPRTFALINELFQKQYPTTRIVPFTEMPTIGVSQEIPTDVLNKVVKEKGCQAVIVGNAG